MRDRGNQGRGSVDIGSVSVETFGVPAYATLGTAETSIFCRLSVNGEEQPGRNKVNPTITACCVFQSCI